jgi:hypothetical protein
MAEIRRINPEEARFKVQAGAALLVCAYDSEETCNQMRLEGTMTMGELDPRLARLDKDQEIIFYCD